MSAVHEVAAGLVRHALVGQQGGGHVRLQRQLRALAAERPKRELVELLAVLAVQAATFAARLPEGQRARVLDELARPERALMLRLTSGHSREGAEVSD